MKKYSAFNIPKDNEDKRRLLIDLENSVGVLIKEEGGKFLILSYVSEKEKELSGKMLKNMREIRGYKKEIFALKHFISKAIQILNETNPEA